jgi:endonuclease YncB( thermonuclease family)
MLDQRLIGKFPTAMLALALLLLASPAAAREGGTVRGSATVRDADTVVVGGTTVVRLRGVDAEEPRTPRGWQAKQAMRAIVGDGDLVCRLTGERTWGREVGFCFKPDGTDISQAIIAGGWALSCPRYDTRYLRFETVAAQAAQPRSNYCIRRTR